MRKENMIKQGLRRSSERNAIYGETYKG